MSWRAVARKDVRDSARAKSVWLLTGVFLLFFLGLAYAVPLLGDDEFDTFLQVSSMVVSLFLPLVGIVLGYKAVIAERESGTVALLLSLPHSRRDVAIGKFVGRSIVLLVPTVIGLLAAAPLVAVRYQSVDPLQYAGFALATVGFGLTFLALAIGLSMATTASRRVTAGAFGAYVGLVMVWTTVVDVVVVLLFRFEQSALASPPSWAPFAKLLDPTTAYAYLLGDGIGSGIDPPVSTFGDHWFTEPPVAVLVLVAWIVVPLVLGFRRFERSDL